VIVLQIQNERRIQLRGIIKRGDKLLAEIDNFEKKEGLYTSFTLTAGSYGDLLAGGSFHIYLEDGCSDLFRLSGTSTKNKIQVFKVLTADEITTITHHLSCSSPSFSLSESSLKA
jgi:translation initiation factor IF-1